FPSIYQGGVNSWKCVPQMIEWQLLTGLFSLGSLLEPWLLVPAMIGLFATLWRCVAHALETNIDRLPLTNQRHRAEFSTGLDRLRYRAMVAWLHYVQPWARLRGQVKGSLGRSHLTPEGARLIETAPRLSLKETFRLLLSRFEAVYWDTHYTS